MLPKPTNEPPCDTQNPGLTAPESFAADTPDLITDEGPAGVSRGRQRRDITAQASASQDRLIRFVAGPESQVVPDLKAVLPGRGLWVAATRSAVELAVRRNLFSRAARTKLTPAPDLADQVEALLAARCLELLGLARRSGMLVSGFEKVFERLKAGQIAWLIEASDGAADGRTRLLAIARHGNVPLFGRFSTEALSHATGLENPVHLALMPGRQSDLWSRDAARLAGFSPLCPAGWSTHTDTRNFPVRPSGFTSSESI